MLQMVQMQMQMLEGVMMLMAVVVWRSWSLPRPRKAT